LEGKRRRRYGRTYSITVSQVYAQRRWLFGRRDRGVRGGREGANGRRRRIWEYPLCQCRVR